MKKKYLTEALKKYDVHKGYGRRVFGDSADIQKLRAIHNELVKVSEEDDLDASITRRIKEIYKKMEPGSVTHKTVTTLRNQMPLSDLKSKLAEQQSIILQVIMRGEYDKKNQSKINEEALQKKQEYGFGYLANPDDVKLKFRSNLFHVNFPHGVPTPSLINTSYDRLLYLENSRKELLSIQDKIKRLKSKGVPDEDIEDFISKKEIKKTWGLLLEQYKMCVDDLQQMIIQTITTNVDVYLNKKGISGLNLTFKEELVGNLSKIYNLLTQLKEEDVPEKNKRDLEEIKATFKSAVEKLNDYYKVELKRSPDKSHPI